MNYHASMWPNFLAYLDAFEPYRKHQARFIEYFGNAPAPTALRDRALALYNPMSNRMLFNCGYRFCINVYASCSHGCLYCYVAEPQSRTEACG